MLKGSIEENVLELVDITQELCGKIEGLESRINQLEKDNADNHRLIDNLKLQLDNHKRFENHD